MSPESPSKHHHNHSHNSTLRKTWRLNEDIGHLEEALDKYKTNEVDVILEKPIKKKPFI